MGLLQRLRSRHNSFDPKDEGFTLIELVIVVAVIGILSAVAIPSFGAIQETTRQEVGRTTAKNTYAVLVSSTTGVTGLSEAQVLENASTEDTVVTVNSWSNESDLCVTVSWLSHPESTQEYGLGC